MTTRLSMEIQGVPYDNIEKTIAFLGEHGLMTGGTGAKVCTHGVKKGFHKGAAERNSCIPLCGCSGWMIRTLHFRL